MKKIIIIIVALVVCITVGMEKADAKKNKGLELIGVIEKPERFDSFNLIIHSAMFPFKSDNMYVKVTIERVPYKVMSMLRNKAYQEKEMIKSVGGVVEVMSDDYVVEVYDNESSRNKKFRFKSIHKQNEMF